MWMWVVNVDANAKHEPAAYSAVSTAYGRGMVYRVFPRVSAESGTNMKGVFKFKVLSFSQQMLVYG